MSDISKIKVSGVEYDIKDIQAREDLGNLGTRVTELEQHGGGAGAMVVTFTSPTVTSISADKTVEEVTAAMANMPVIGNINAFDPINEKPITIHLGACFAEFGSDEHPTPAFGPFRYDVTSHMILGTIGVNSSGQWESRLNRS